MADLPIATAMPNAHLNEINGAQYIVRNLVRAL
jgi:hypothetical protein